jgi:hypothetical protein
MSNHNQPELEVTQKKLWLEERDLLAKKVSDFCLQNNYYFCRGSKIDLNTDLEKIVFFQLGDLIADYAVWKKLNDQCRANGKTITVICDNWLEFSNLENVFFYGLPELNGVMSVFDIPSADTAKWDRHYNCFIQRVDSVRQTWLYFLHQHKLLDQGYVSFLLKQLSSYSTLTGAELFRWIHYNYKLDQLQHFDQAYHELLDIVPYRNFTETLDLNEYIMRSKYSLVLETYAVEDNKNSWYFSEKALRDLQYPNYSLLFVQQYGISKLQQMGFEMSIDLDRIDNESWQNRQRLLLETLIADSGNLTHSELSDIALHNQSIVKKWKNDYSQPTYFDKIFEHLLSH